MRGGGSGGSVCGDPFAIGDEEGLVRQAARNQRHESGSLSDDYSDDEGMPDGARLAEVFASLASGSNASIRVDVLRQLLAQQQGAMYDDEEEAGTGAGGGGVGSGPAACRQQ